MRDSDATLRLALRGLREDVAPTGDLWPGIHAAIADASQPRGSAPVLWHWASYALAASLTLAVGLAWRLNPLPGPRAPHTDAAARIEAEFRPALQALEQHPLPPAAQPGAQALEAGAAQIRRALQRDPDSRLLLEQLRRTYRQRLALSRQAALA